MKSHWIKFRVIVIGLSALISARSLAQAPDPFQPAPGPAPAKPPIPHPHSPLPGREAEPTPPNRVIAPTAPPVARDQSPVEPPVLLSDADDYRPIGCTDSKIFLSPSLKCYFSSLRGDRQSIDCSNYRYSTEGRYGKYVLAFRLKYVSPAGPGCFYGENSPQGILSDETRTNAATAQQQRIGEYDSVSFAVGAMSCLSFSQNLQPQLRAGGGKHGRRFYVARYAEVIFGYICKQESNPLTGNEFEAIVQSLQIRL
jgi:hypothetical protein